MKTFCPSCEKETNCVYIAELYECKECGCDFESKQRQMQERLDAANARAEAAESTLDEVYVLTTRELAEPCGKETDTLVKIASTIEAIRLGARDALKGGEE